jgi:hypothetical protein
VSDILACLVLSCLSFAVLGFPPQGYEGRVRRCDTIQLESIQVSGAGFGSNWESSKDSCGGDAMAMAKTKTNKELDTRTCHGFNDYRNQKQRTGSTQPQGKASRKRNREHTVHASMSCTPDPCPIPLSCSRPMSRATGT